MMEAQRQPTKILLLRKDQKKQLAIICDMQHGVQISVCVVNYTAEQTTKAQSSPLPN